MAHLKIDKFKKEDVNELALVKNNELAFTMNGIFEVYEMFNNSFTLRDQSKVILCGGIVDFWSGVGEVWLLLDQSIDENKFGACKAMKEVILNAFNLNYHRLQATIDVSNERAIRFVEWLGFTREGLLREYNIDKKDYYMYSRVK